jgi:hypothetical protein|tara:strand:+ start:19545 stop:19877 length:333 start_codon:yes stop_codon:yes gene_type:complete
MNYLALTMIVIALIISGIAIVLMIQSMFDRAFDRKLILVYNQVSNFVNGQTKELQKQIDELKEKRGKCERCEKGVPRWDEITDPGFSWDKQASRQRGGDTWPEGQECDSS